MFQKQWMADSCQMKLTSRGKVLRYTQSSPAFYSLARHQPSARFAGISVDYHRIRKSSFTLPCVNFLRAHVKTFCLKWCYHMSVILEEALPQALYMTSIYSSKDIPSRAVALLPAKLSLFRRRGGARTAGIEA